MISPYYYGEYRWDNYLQDVQRNQQASTDVQRQNVRLNEQMLESANEQADELRQQTQELRNVNETLQMGFEEMRAEFNWGFTLMVGRLDEQIDLLSNIAERLDAIHKTLQSPLMTQARELFLIGQDRFKKGLWDKALESYLMAEQKNDVDFPLQFQIGTLYLYGKKDDLNLVDVAKADKHWSFAVRIAEAEKDSLPNWSRSCGEAHFRAAVAAYLVGEREQEAGKVDSMRQCLDRALAHVGRAVSLWPSFTDSVYLQAKCHSLLAQQAQALDALAILSDRDRRYFAKACRDRDFDNIRPSVNRVFQKAINEPGRLAKSTEQLLNKAFGVLEWARRSKPDSSDGEKIETIARHLESGRKALKTLDVDIEGLHAEVADDLRDLDEITKRIFGGRVDAARSQIQETESKAANCRSAVVHLEKEMRETQGDNALGCGLSVLGFLILPVLLSGLEQLPAGRELVAKYLSNHGGAFTFVVVLISLCSFGVGTHISKRKKNRPRRQMIEMHLRDLDSCNSLIPKLKIEESRVKAEFQPYIEWRRNNGVR